MNIEKNNLLNDLENYITGLNPWNDLINIFSAKDNDDWDSDEEFDNDDWEDEDFDDEELEEGEDDDWEDEDEWEDEDFDEEELDNDEEDEWDDFEEESEEDEWDDFGEDSEEDEDWEDDDEEELEFGSFNKKSSEEARNTFDSLKNLKNEELTLDRYDKSVIKLYDSLLLKDIDLVNVINVKIGKFDKFRLN